MELVELSWPAVDALDRDTPVVIPIAALEQHGHHMPLFTDSLLLEEVLRRVKLLPVSQQILFAPLQWLGNSHHHRDMPGTVSASPRLYLDLLIDLAENFLVHDFRRIIFINGHGGNTVPSQQVVFELRQKFREQTGLLLATLTYWHSCQPTETISNLVQTEMGHACEWETSMMLALHPEWIRPKFRDIAEVPFGIGGAPSYRGWTMGDRSEPGHIGHPAVASAEKGEALFGAFAAGVNAYLERVVSWKGDAWNL